MTNQRSTDRQHLLQVLARWLAAHWAGATDIRLDDLGGPSATGFSNDTVYPHARWREQGCDRDGRYVARIEPVETPV